MASTSSGNNFSIKEASYNIRYLLQQTHDQALERNELQTKRWQDYQDDHKEVSKQLLSLRDELTHTIMVPIGKKALMRGNLVHTNEILVCLGDGWFAKRSAKQAADICQRRVQHSEEMLQKLEKERELLTSQKSLPGDNEAFGSADCQEIIEPYDEEEEKQWRESHRQKEKEHRQKLAELRKARKTEVETEDDLWQLLDALDQEEELEDKLHRMRNELGMCSDDESESGSSSENGANQSDTEVEGSKPKVLKRRVSFKEDKENDREEDNESDGNCLKIIFKHSNNPPTDPSESGVSSPADIYTNYQKQRMPKSILKPSLSNKICTSEDDDYIQFSRVNDPTENNDISRLEAPKQKPAEPVVKAVGEVVERNPAVSSEPSADRPVSRFKAARLANKR